MKCPFCGEVVGSRFDLLASNGDMQFTESRTVPTRGASLESDVFVPVLQSVVTGVLVGLPVGAVVFFTGGPWWGAMAAAGGVGAISWLWLLTDSRRLLRVVETVTGRDDGVIGAPTRTTVELIDRERKSMRLVDLPVSDGVLTSVAAHCLVGDRPLSRRGLSGIVSESDFARLQGALLGGGLARYRNDSPQSGVELTGAGKALLRHYL